MPISRRHFIGAFSAGVATLTVAPRIVFAAVSAGPRPQLLPRALAALHDHRALVAHQDIIGIVDFAAPSREQRFQLVDIAGGRVIATHLVAHGRGSDPRNVGLVEHLSNRPGSNASCQGSFVTREIYYGQHGRSMRLDGLEPDNCLARERGIVVHHAAYVSAEMAENQGRVGRSEGCFAVSSPAIEEVLAKLAPGRLLFACK
jgi:hypothetical protein